MSVPGVLCPLILHLLSFSPILKSNFIGAEKNRNEEKLKAQLTVKRQFL